MRLACAQGAEYAAAVARAIADDNARATGVVISGATGRWDESINGYFAASEEKSLDGRVVYSKCGDASMCIEHYGGRWQVKPVPDKGSGRCFASVTGGCALEACTSRVWNVGDGNAYGDQASVKIATGADAEREVSGCCMRPQQSTNHSPSSPSTPSPPPQTLCDMFCFRAGR